MAVLTDHQLGWIPEVTWGTALTVTRFAPWMDASKIDFDPLPLQGTGLWTGAPGGVDRADRRIAGIGRGSGAVIVEAASKGLGNLISAATGTVTHTLVSGSTFQQVFTPTVATLYLPSLTIQEGIVDNTGAVNAMTYAGCTITDWQLEIPRGAGPDSIAKWTFNFDAKTMSTATGLASFVGPSGATLYSWVGSGLASTTITVGGTVTPATTTALATSSGAASSNFGGIVLKSNNSLDVERWVPGGRNQQAPGKRSHQITFDYEYTDNTYRALQISQGVTSLLIDIPTSEALSSGTARLQIAIPAMKIDMGSMPEPTQGQTVLTSVQATILWDGANQPFQIVQRTADAAI